MIGKRKIPFSFTLPGLCGTLVLFSLLYTCQRIEPELILEITTDEIVTLSGGEYKLNGSIVSFGEEEIEEHGFCWSVTTEPVFSGSSTKLGRASKKGSFTSTITGLTPGTKYYVRAYANTNGLTEYGEEKPLTTPASDLPVLTTTEVSSIGQDSAKSGGVITDNGGSPITERGVCWDSTAAPTIGSLQTTDGDGSGNFTSTMRGLDCGTKYYVRAYATNSAGTGYGDQLEFTTASCLLGDPPTVTTGIVNSITDNSASGGGEVLDEGGSQVTARGVCWSTAHEPIVSDGHSSDGTGSGSFSSQLTALAKSTTYYVRAYATNLAGTGYGEEDTIKTYEGFFEDFEGNRYFSVLIGYQEWAVKNLKTTRLRDGSMLVLEETATAWADLKTPGYCWYDNDENSYKDTYGALYNGYTVFSHKLCPAGWHVSTYEDWDILVESLGGIEVAADKLRETGSEHWTTYNSEATNEVGFTAIPTGIRSYQGNFFGIENTAYFYSPSTDGTNYEKHFGTGSWVLDGSFDLASGLAVRCVKGVESFVPFVETIAVSNISTSSADVEAEVINNGGVTVLQRGICWDTHSYPQISDHYTSDDGGVGIYTIAISDLLPNTSYYARAYAINSIGTYYGEQLAFTTPEYTPAVSDYDGNVYSTTKIGDQVWMAENLRTTHYSDGSAIPFVEDSAEWASLADLDKAYCWYRNDPLNEDIYGGLYTWGAAMNGASSSNANPSGVQGVCPSGWHLPSDSEWIELIGVLGGANVAGGKLKETGFTHWNSPNTGATNEGGFTALPAGLRSSYGAFGDLGNYTYLWSSYMETTNARAIELSYGTDYVYPWEDIMGAGNSVRCIED